jgi:hypothetical protein
MIGLSRSTGRLLTGWEYFIELATDALTTQLASREKRRDYGSRLPSLLSRLQSDDVLMLAQIYATETFIHPPNLLQALFKVERITATRTELGIQLQISGLYQSQAVSFSVPINP